MIFSREIKYLPHLKVVPPTDCLQLITGEAVLYSKGVTKVNTTNGGKN